MKEHAQLKQAQTAQICLSLNLVHTQPYLPTKSLALLIFRLIICRCACFQCQLFDSSSFRQFRTFFSGCACMSCRLLRLMTTCLLFERQGLPCSHRQWRCSVISSWFWDPPPPEAAAEDHQHKQQDWWCRCQLVCVRPKRCCSYICILKR